MVGRRNAQGFTLIEVLVALAIIAVAMAAAVRVAGLMTQSVEEVVAGLKKFSPQERKNYIRSL